MHLADEWWCVGDLRPDVGHAARSDANWHSTATAQCSVPLSLPTHERRLHSCFERGLADSDVETLQELLRFSFVAVAAVSFVCVWIGTKVCTVGNHELHHSTKSNFIGLTVDTLLCI